VQLFRLFRAWTVLIVRKPQPLSLVVDGVFCIENGPLLEHFDGWWFHREGKAQFGGCGSPSLRRRSSSRNGSGNSADMPDKT